MDIVGALLGHLLDVVLGETVGLFIPAEAEIALEGTIKAKVREPQSSVGVCTRRTDAGWPG